MKLFQENPQTTGYLHKPHDFTETYYYGDFLRKTAEFLKDSEEKDSLVCRATDIQHKDYTSLEIYNKALRQFDNELSRYIGTHEDPFIIT
jgi:hypothetical protein